MAWQLSDVLYYIVSLHQTTTFPNSLSPVMRLYYIVSLHQTTTADVMGHDYKELYYIVSLHQTTTVVVPVWLLVRCIISFLYIKPQQ